MIENQIEKTMNSNNLRIYVGIPRLTSIDRKTVEMEKQLLCIQNVIFLCMINILET